MSVYKDKKTNTYYVKYRNRLNNNKSTTKRGFKTKEDAKIFEANILASKKEIFTTNAYFKDVAYDYLAHHKKEVTEGTYMKTNGIMNNYIFKYFKNKRIGYISNKDCMEFRDLIGNMELSSTHKNRILEVFKLVFKHAVKWYGLQYNASLVIDRFKKTREEIKNSKIKTLPIEDLNKIIDNIEPTKPEYRALIITIVTTGLRKGEALALTWKDYDGHSLNVNKSSSRKTTHRMGNRNEIIKETKNASSDRKVALTDNVIDFLNRYKEKQMEYPGFNENWFMFGQTRTLPPQTLDKVKDRAIKKAGVERITIHEMRHSYVTNNMNNFGLETATAISKSAGHASVITTLDNYTHSNRATEDLLIQLSNAINQHKY